MHFDGNVDWWFTVVLYGEGLLYATHIAVSIWIMATPTRSNRHDQKDPVLTR